MTDILMILVPIIPIINLFVVVMMFSKTEELYDLTSGDDDDRNNDIS